jgi:hypothetical protein
LNDVDLAYYAGYFDGEGSVIIRRNKYGYFIAVQLGNTYKPAILALQAEFGGGMYPFKSHGVGRQVWQWYIGAMGACKFLTQILPFLKEKAEQAREVIEFYELYGMHTHPGGHSGRTVEEKIDQEARYQKVRALKVVEYVA